MMRPIKSLARFCLWLMIVDAVLITPWLGAPWLFREAFVAGGNLALGSLGDQRVVRFEAIPIGPERFDTQMTLTNSHTGRQGDVPINSRYFGLLPMAFLIGLIIATLLPWRRRIRALLWGGSAMTLLVFVRVLVHMLFEFSAD